MHPVVAVYATFLNRAFDQVLLDVAMHRLPVTFVLDRAGITGPDGPSHYGIWDMAVFGVVPGLRIAAPRDARHAAGRAARGGRRSTTGRPSCASRPARSRADLPARAHASAASTCWPSGDAARRAAGRRRLVRPAGRRGGRPARPSTGYGVTVVDPRWVRPVPVELVGLAAAHRLVVVVEDGVRTGGVGGAVAQTLRDAGVATPVRELGVEPGWHPHGTRAEILADLGLTAQDVARQVTGWISHLDATSEVTATL